MKKVTKALPTGNISTVFDHPTDEELNIINTRTQREFTAEELYVITIHLANDDKDKVGDIMTETFLTEFAELAQANNLPGQLNHNEDVKETWANIFEAHVEENNGRKEIVGRAYVVANDDNKKLLDKIESGTIGSISISFNGEGEPIGMDSFLWTHCETAREFSIVVCPCQDNTGITKDLDAGASQQPSASNKDTDNKKSNGGKKMKAIERFKALVRKSMENAENPENIEITPDMMPLLDDPDRELSEHEIELQEEVDRLKAELEEQKGCYEAKIKELQEQLDAQGAAAEEQEGAAIDAILDTEIEKLNPLTPTVKSNMLRDIDRSQLKLNAGQVEGLTDQIENIKKSYEGLFGEKSQAPTKKSAPFTTVSTKKTVTKKSFDEACKNFG